MKGTCNINGIIGEMFDQDGKLMTPNTTFLEVARQVESQKGLTELDVFIKTPGGLVEEGLDIYNYFEALKKKGVQVNTHAQESVCSIGVEVFLSGDQRFIQEGCEFMIHNPWVSLKEGDADVVEAYGKELRKLENNAIDFYSTHTGTSKEALKTLMKKDTFLTPEQAVEFGFATSITQKVQLDAVAFSRKFSNPKSNKMSDKALTKDEAEGLFKNWEKKFKSFFKPKALKVVQDANANDIEFPDLEEDDTPSVGDKATIDGKPADGERVIPYYDNATYVFKDGEIESIKPADEETSEEMQQLQDEVKSLKSEAKNREKKFKALQKKNKELEDTISDSNKMLKDMRADMKALNKSFKSGFSHDGGDGNDGKGKGKGEQSRQLFKKEKE